MKVYRVTTAAQVAHSYPCTIAGVHFWSDGLPLSRAWFIRNLGRHIEGLHAVDDEGTVVGHLYWSPSAQALVPYRLEEGAAWIYCEWVREEHRGRGYSRLLFDSLVDYLRAEECKGILVEGTGIDGFMHSSHFQKRGFNFLREGTVGQIMYLPLQQETVQVEPLPEQIPTTHTAPVEVLVVGSYFCPLAASTVLALRRIAQEMSGQVVLKEFPSGPEALERYGVADGIFVNGRPCFFEPTTEQGIREEIREEVERRGDKTAG